MRAPGVALAAEGVRPVLAKTCARFRPRPVFHSPMDRLRHAVAAKHCDGQWGVDPLPVGQPMGSESLDETGDEHEDRNEPAAETPRDPGYGPWGLSVFACCEAVVDSEGGSVTPIVLARRRGQAIDIISNCQLSIFCSQESARPGVAAGSSNARGFLGLCQAGVQGGCKPDQLSCHKVRCRCVGSVSLARANRAMRA